MWKPIQNEEYYEISDDGRVRNKETKHIKSLRDSRNGYLRVKLYPSGKTYTIHRLVGIAFLKKVEGLTEINHINGVKHDNKCSNLEWCSSSENQKHAFKLGLQLPNKGVDNGSAKLNIRDVRDIKFSEDLKGLSNPKVAEMFNVSVETIRRIRKNILWKHVVK